MNYYEHHLGDYLRDTAHLSVVEDGIYRRLIDQYYIRERPLPTDVKECCKLARATSKPERDAVAYVLKSFFALGADGHRHKRCEDEIERYRQSQADSEAERENERERQKRARERRRQLFEQLRGHGIVLPWNTTTEELVTHLSRVTSCDRHDGCHGDRHAPVTAHDTAIQTPDTRHQTPDTKTQEARAREREVGGDEFRPVGIPAGTDPGALGRWEAWLRSRGKPTNDLSRTAIARRLVAFGDAAAQAAAVEHSIERQWLSLHAAKPDHAAKPRPRLMTPEEIEAEEAARATG